MDQEKKQIWADRLDSFGAVFGGFLPLGLVIGNFAFELVIALVGLQWLVRCVLMKNNPIPGFFKHPILFPWLAWLVCVFLSFLWNLPGGKGLGHDVVLLRYFLYVAAMIDIATRRPVLKYLVIGMGAGILWGFFNTVLAYLIGHDVFGRPLWRYDFKFKDAHRFASLATFTGPFFLAWGIFGLGLTLKKRVFILLISYIALNQLFHAHIRTYEIAAVFGIMVLGVHAVKRYAGLLPAILALLLVGVSIWGFARFGPRVDLRSTYDRFGIWKVVLAMGQEKPILGVSVAGWQDAYKEKVNSETVQPYIAPDGLKWQNGNPYHAHNLFLQLFSSTGILGLGAFTWLFFNLVRLVFRKQDLYGYALLIWPVVFLTIGLTGWNIYGAQNQTLFAFFAAMTGVAAKIKSVSDG